MGQNWLIKRYGLNYSFIFFFKMVPFANPEPNLYVPTEPDNVERFVTENIDNNGPIAIETAVLMPTETDDANRTGRVKKRLNTRNRVHALGAMGINSGLFVNNLSQV